MVLQVGKPPCPGCEPDSAKGFLLSSFSVEPEEGAPVSLYLNNHSSFLTNGGPFMIKFFF